MITSPVRHGAPGTRRVSEIPPVRLVQLTVWSRVSSRASRISVLTSQSLVLVKWKMARTRHLYCIDYVYMHKEPIHSSLPWFCYV